ncbi:MAG: hypothetical protein NC218_09635 [Acetobacter sp.]|nr:hypothetical protein [Acetobacter sp.]
MSATKYLDKNGVLYLWGKIKTLVTDNKVTELPWGKITDKPTDLVKTDDIKDFVKKGDLTSMMTYKGSVATYSALPVANATAEPPVVVNVGDCYNVSDTGTNYVWDGSDWDDVGGGIQIEALTNSEIDEICGTTPTVENNQNVVDLDTETE